MFERTVERWFWRNRRLFRSMKSFHLIGVGLIVLSLLPVYAQDRGGGARDSAHERRERPNIQKKERDDHRPYPAVRRLREQVRELEQGAQRDSHQGRQRLRELEPKSLVPEGQSSPAGEEQRKIFDRIRDGMNSGNIAALSQFFGSQVLCNLRDGESGYYSANQAFYLLENYFRVRKIVSFGLSTIGDSDTNPYATGSATFNVKGTREVAQVYISLSLAGDRWVITQINIY